MTHQCLKNHHASPLTLSLCVQGQVTRAQEAEENYVIKRELAVVRQQYSTASESLGRAQDTIQELQQHKVAGSLSGPGPGECASLS